MQQEAQEIHSLSASNGGSSIGSSSLSHDPKSSASTMNFTFFRRQIQCASNENIDDESNSNNNQRFALPDHISNKIGTQIPNLPNFNRNRSDEMSQTSTIVTVPSLAKAEKNTQVQIVHLPSASLSSSTTHTPDSAGSRKKPLHEVITDDEIKKENELPRQTNKDKNLMRQTSNSSIRSSINTLVVSNVDKYRSSRTLQNLDEVELSDDENDDNENIQGKIVSRGMVGIVEVPEDSKSAQDALQNKNEQPFLESVILQQFDMDMYFREQEIQILRKGNIQALYASLAYMCCVLSMSCLYFKFNGNWLIRDTLLWSVYTFTTVGYGNYAVATTCSSISGEWYTENRTYADCTWFDTQKSDDRCDLYGANTGAGNITAKDACCGCGGGYTSPNTGTQIFIIIFTFVGLASYIILQSQIYKLIGYEVTYAQNTYYNTGATEEIITKADTVEEKDDSNYKWWKFCFPRRKDKKRGSDKRQSLMNFRERGSTSLTRASIRAKSKLVRTLLYWCSRFSSWTKKLAKTSTLNRLIGVSLPFVILVSTGALVVGSIEGWPVMTSIYWAVVSLTTVGYGDFYPTKPASIWFCIVYLLFSNIFMTLFLAKVAVLYFKRHRRMVDKIQNKLIEVGKLDMSTDGPVGDSGPSRRSNNESHRSLCQSEIKQVSGLQEDLAWKGDTDEESKLSASKFKTAFSTKQVRSTMHRYKTMKQVMQMESMEKVLDAVNQGIQFRANDVLKHGIDHLSVLELEIKMQERLAQIVATEVFSEDPQLTTEQDGSICVSVNRLKSIVFKWMIPQKAHDTFYSVVLKVLFQAGTVENGDQRLAKILSLKPKLFQELFAPLVASMGDDETSMKLWLVTTDYVERICGDQEMKIRPSDLINNVSMKNLVRQRSNPNAISYSSNDGNRVRRDKSKSTLNF